MEMSVTLYREESAAPLVVDWRRLINKGQRDDLDSATH
jgi:hypothetical protein